MKRWMFRIHVITHVGLSHPLWILCQHPNLSRHMITRKRKTMTSTLGVTAGSYVSAQRPDHVMSPDCIQAQLGVRGAHMGLETGVDAGFSRLRVAAGASPTVVVEAKEREKRGRFLDNSPVQGVNTHHFADNMNAKHVDLFEAIRREVLPTPLVKLIIQYATNEYTSDIALQAVALWGLEWRDAPYVLRVGALPFWLQIECHAQTTHRPDGWQAAEMLTLLDEGESMSDSADEFTDGEETPEYGDQFDSTLGYPGEGPERGKKKQGQCFRCGARDHYQRDCPMQDGGASESSTDSEDEKEERVPLFNDDDENELRKLEVETDLVAKAETMWATRDLKKQSEVESITKSLAQIARVSGYHKYEDANLTGKLVVLVQAARVLALQHRLRAARNRALLNARLLHTAGRITHFRRAWAEWLKGWKNPHLSWGHMSDYEELDWLESDPTMTGFGFWSRAGAVAYSLFNLSVEMIEEACKQHIRRALQRLGLHEAFAVCFAGALWAVFEAHWRGMSWTQACFIARMHTMLMLVSHFTHPIVAWFLHKMWNVVKLQSIQRLRIDEAVEDVCCADHGLQPVSKLSEGFSARWGEPECVPKFGARPMWSVDGFQATVFRQCGCNERIAVTGRVGKQLPSHGIAAQVVGRWRKLSKTIMPHFRENVQRVTKPMEFSEWLKEFPPQRREELRRDYEQNPDQKDSTAKGFIKREIAVKPLDNMTFKDPRWIQGCPLWMTRTCGPWLRRLAKQVRRGLAPTCLGRAYAPVDIHQGKQIVYTCGMNTNAIGEAFGRALDTIQGLCGPGDEVVVVEDDESRFDMHIAQGPFEFLDQIYRQKIGKRQVAASLRRTSKSMGYGLRGTKYSIPYTMQSGWPDTSVGDTLVNAALKFHVHGKGRPWISIICGDDSVTVTLRSEVQKLGMEDGIRKLYEEMGMEVDVKIRHNPLDVEFCSSRFYPWRHTYVLMPKPGRLLSKIGWDMKDRPNRDQLSWVRGIAQTLKHYGGVDPLMYSLGSALEQDAGEGHVIREFSPYKLQLGKQLPRDWDGVHLYYNHHYDIGIDSLKRLETRIGQSRIGDVVADPDLERMVRVDLG